MAAEQIQSSPWQGGPWRGLSAGPGLPPGFVFSQGSLQDYTDCPRRFWLRYVLRLAWPAVQSEPALENERRLQQGQRFHRLAQQYWLGVPADRLEAMIHDAELRLWWEPFVRFAQGLRGAGRLYAELGLSAPLGEQRLVAQFDLVAAGEDGRFTIYDWKTSARKPPRDGLKERLQTRVYPYLLRRAGAGLNAGQPIPPESIEMVYWFPAQPDQPERFAYSVRLYEEDQAALVGLAQEIARRAASADAPSAEAPEAFPLTTQEKRCAYCVYRSLCERGERAGSVEAGDLEAEAESEREITLDFEQVAEIEF
jgi:hypothetical protein